MKKILIVDDDRNFPRVLSHQLEEMGFEVEAVQDGSAAVERCQKEVFHLIVATLNVPISRRLSFIQRIRSRYPGLPVLVLSAFSSMETVASALRYGATEFLEKPCETATLRQMIKKLTSDPRRAPKHPSRRPQEKTALRSHLGAKMGRTEEPSCCPWSRSNPKPDPPPSGFDRSPPSSPRDGGFPGPPSSLLRFLGRK